MGNPLPYDSEDRPEPDPEFERPSRADWLVGAEEGMSAEMSRSQGNTPLPFSPPKLARPEGGEQPALPTDERQPFQAPRVPQPGTPAVQVMPRWDTGQNSVPMLKREREAPSAPSAPIPELTRDFPMDDAEERSRVAAEMAERRAEEEAVASRPHAVVKPDEFEIPTVPERGLTNLKALLATDRRVQGALGVVVVALLAMTFWPRAEKTISVAHLKAEPERFADTQVRVSGKVAEVFPVGGSWAFSLVQGRDTIVVFTRARVPKLHEKLVVVGMLSNGYLDGMSRAAIFESNR